MKQKRAFRLCSCFFGLALLVFSSCDYDDEFDALSAFPGNLQGLSATEVDLIEVNLDAGENETLLPIAPIESTVAPEQQTVEVQPGVMASPFTIARDQAESQGNFANLDGRSIGIIDEPYLEFNVGNADKLNSPFVGTGIAVGDLNGDDLPDLFVANQRRGGRLFRNLGNMKFKDVTVESGIKIDSMWGTSATLVDINNDGQLDIYLCGYDSPNRLFINRGRKFIEQSERYGLDIQGACVSASFADYDRDGDLDVYLVNNRLPQSGTTAQLPVERAPGEAPRIKEEFRELNHLIPFHDGGYVPVESGQYDRLLRNEGYKFVDVTEESILEKQPYKSMCARWLDFDDDQWPDLYISVDDKDPDQLLRNLGPDETGKVAFEDVTKQFLSHTSWFSKGIELSDIDHDGRLDLIVCGCSPNDPFERAASRGNLFGEGSDAWFLNWSDLSQKFGNSCYLNQGFEKQMVEIANTAGVGNAGYCWSVRARDFDNDSKEELFFVNGQPRPFFDNDMNRELRRALKEGSIDSKREFWLKKQVVKTPNLMFRQTNNIEFESVGLRWGVDSIDVSQVIASGDLDNDGDIDIVTSGYKDKIRVYRNDLNSLNAVRIQLVGLQSNFFGVGATIRLSIDSEGTEQVRRLSSTSGFMSSDAPLVHFGLGDADVIASLSVEWPSGHVQTLKNLPANFHYEIKEPKSAQLVSRGIELELEKKMFAREKTRLDKVTNGDLPYDDFERQPMLPFKHSQLGPGLSWADIDGDEDDDLFIGGAAYETSKLFENRGNFKFRQITMDCFDADKRCEDLGAVFFDFDRDGDQDLYVVSGGVESDVDSATMSDRLYRNDGKGGFEKTEDVLPNVSFSGSSVAVVDFDDDGDLDLFVGGRIKPGKFPAGPRSMLMRNLGAKFEEVTDEVAPELANAGMITSAIWSDINNNGMPDLLVCNEFGPVRCFQNSNGQLTEVTVQANLESRSGFFNSICGGDVDNDGDIDFVVGNIGTNTTYVSEDNQTIALQYGKFGDDELDHILETFTHDGQVYPRQSLDALERINASLSQRFESSRQFSRTSIDEIFEENVLNAAQQFEINSIESGVLLNVSTANEIKFEFVALPKLAQSSPVYGCQLTDVDGNGTLDLFLIQNNYSVNPLVERFASGCGMLLLGRGDGQFELPKNNSGVEVRGAGTALTTVDLNGDAKADFVAATNNNGISVFANRSRHIPFAIDLRRISAGKNFIGAKVLLAFKNGKTQLHEIRASNGYLSQSAPIIFSGLNIDHEIEKISIWWPDGSKKSGTVKSLFNK